MEYLDNSLKKLGDNLKKELQFGSNVQVCASIFSMYGFHELKKELAKIEQFHFVFTQPTFITNITEKKTSKEFEINIAEKSINGSSFEVKLKNELTSKEIAKECVAWIKEKATFKSNLTNRLITPFINLIKDNSENITYIGTNSFDTIGLGYKKDDTIFSPVNKITSKTNFNTTNNFFKSFNDIWEYKCEKSRKQYFLY